MLAAHKKRCICNGDIAGLEEVLSSASLKRVRLPSHTSWQPSMLTILRLANHQQPLPCRRANVVVDNILCQFPLQRKRCPNAGFYQRFFPVGTTKLRGNGGGVFRTALRASELPRIKPYRGKSADSGV